MKAGAACTKLGAKASQAGKRFTCVRSGQRLVWRLIKSNATPTPKPLAVGEFTIVAPAKRVPFPTWSGQTIDGNPWSTSALLGSVTLVNIWASWCGPCRTEWPELQAAAAAHPTVRFVGINTMDKLESVRAFLHEQPSTYPQVFDERAVIKSSLTTVPTMVLPISMILDVRGRIAAWVPGPTTRQYLSRAFAAIS